MATHILCPMYARVSDCVRLANKFPDFPLIQCEYAHMMGNSGGGLEVYWKAYRYYPRLQVRSIPTQRVRLSLPILIKSAVVLGRIHLGLGRPKHPQAGRKRREFLGLRRRLWRGYYRWTILLQRLELGRS